MSDPNKIEELLLERGLIKPEQIQRIHRRQEAEQKSFLDVLREEKIVYPEQLAQVKAEATGVPYIDLSSVQPDEKAMRDISRQAAATYHFFAFGEKGGKLQVALESPNDFQALEAVKFIAKKRGLTPEVFISSQEGIDKMLGGSSEIQVEIGSALRDFSAEVAQTKLPGKDDKDIARYIAEAPVTKVVAVIIRHAIEGNASDIHVEPTAKDLRIRYRIDGALHTSLLLPKRAHLAIISRIKILSNLKIDESRLPQDGRFSITADQRAFDFRVSVMPTVFGEKIALRILDKSRGAPSFDELGLRGPQQKIFREHLTAPHGIILISGPTGAGKSTTLFTSVSLINTPEVNIATLEDPVEYDIQGVNQTQINPAIGLTFASGLRNLLRQDPDILMVGEIRDKETAALAVHSSLTGHLVLSTIHTNDAVGTVPRLIDMGIDPYLLTATLRLLAAQRLVGKLCPACKKEQDIPSRLREKIAAELAHVPADYKTSSNLTDPRHLYVAEGCPACHETGTVGRLAIFEIIPVSRKMRSAINESADYDILYDIARSEGYLSMRQDGLLKALAGEVQYEDVLRVTSQSQSLY
ncbi:MAG: GspE/PulE family protein [bacterium]|nr:GspE/PulE family protein [bacterium]